MSRPCADSSTKPFIITPGLATNTSSPPNLRTASSIRCLTCDITRDNIAFSALGFDFGGMGTYGVALGLQIVDNDVAAIVYESQLDCAANVLRCTSDDGGRHVSIAVYSERADVVAGTNNTRVNPTLLKYLNTQKQDL